MKLTKAQQAIVDWLKKEPHRFVSYYNSPGDHNNRHSGWYWPMAWFEGAPKADARTLNAMSDRGIIVSIGDNDFGLSKEYQ